MLISSFYIKHSSNDLDSEIDGTGGDDDFLTGDNGNDPFSGGGNEAADYFDFNFNGIFGAVLGLDVNLDSNDGQHSSSSNISPTDIINTIENFIGTKHNDRITVFASLNGEKYGVTADVAYEGYRSDFSTGSADKFTRSGIFEGIDTSIDIKFSFDDGVIATEDFVEDFVAAYR